MKMMTGDAAVRAAITGTHILDTTDGIIVFPGSESSRRTALYRPRYAGHLPEFWPADAAEACRMARSARLYAETYRTPVLIRLPAEIRNSRITVIPKKTTMTERRSADYIMDRQKREAAVENISGNASGAGGMHPAPDGKKTGTDGGKLFPGGRKLIPDGRKLIPDERKPGTARKPAVPEEAFSDSCWNPILGHGGKGIIVRGPAYRRVLRILNGYSGVRVLKIGTAWPLPESHIRRFLQSVRTALVLDDTQEDLLIPVYAIKGKYELTGNIVPFEGMEDSSEDLAAAVVDLAGRDAVMDILRMRA